MSLKIKNIGKKEMPAKKIIEIKDVSLYQLRLIDAETGENVTPLVLAEAPKGVESVSFKLTFELPE